MAEQITRHWKLAVAWALSLVAVGALTSWAQVPGSGIRAGTLPQPMQIPTIVSGSDVGFRIERSADGIQIGRVVVRVDGRWVDTAAPPIPTR